MHNNIGVALKPNFMSSFFKYAYYIPICNVNAVQDDISTKHVHYDCITVYLAREIGLHLSKVG